MRKLLAVLFCAPFLMVQAPKAHGRALDRLPPVLIAPAPKAQLIAVGSVDLIPRGPGIGYKVLAVPVTISVRANMTAPEMGKAIAAAASARGWMPKSVDEGTIEAKLLIRTHELVVDIAYTATKYTIKYKSSKNLGYNEKRQTIHKNYKKWLGNLDAGIKETLLAILVAQGYTLPKVQGRTVASVDELPHASGGWVLAMPVIIAVRENVTATEVGKAIAAAASAHGWIPKLINEGTIEARLPIRTHELVVDIDYGAIFYAIKYKRSFNLRYDENRQTIHRNYKAWLKELDTGIQGVLQATAIQKALSDPSENPLATP
jgi:NADH:ubiquinone oxidoreductase subunit